MKRVIIAEDELFLREMFEELVQSMSFEVAGLASNGLETLELLQEAEADLLITDIEMPGMDGIDLVRAVKEVYPGMKVIALTGHENPRYLREMLAAGVDGYVLKQSPASEFKEVLRGMDHPGLQFCTKSRRNLKEVLASEVRQLPKPDSYYSLTAQELNVIGLYGQGRTTTEIAKALYISRNTVANHRRSAYVKLNVHSMQELVSFVRKYGIGED